VNRDFRVGPWLVQPSLNTISQNGTSNHVEPKMMGVLVCLAEHTGEVVPKEKLLKAVWPDTFVCDDVLKRSISELRRVFGDDPRESRIIETIPKRGYRLVAAVKPVNGHLPTDFGKLQTLQTEAPQAGLATRKWKIGLVALAVLVFVCGLILVSNVAGITGRFLGKGALPPIRSLAVLPLQNLSGDPSQDYFADGMTEELITQLSRLSSLRVISRTSIMHYKKTEKALPDIARELNVDAILEGAVLRSGDRVRITAQLIYAPKDTHLWAETYDHDLRDVLTLQSAVAKAVADEIRVKLTPTERESLQTPRPVNLQAHELYLQGRYYLALPRGCTRAVEFFQRAIQAEPTAMAYVGLARAYDCLTQVEIAPVEILPKEEAAAQQALRLDQNSSDAHLVLAQTRVDYDRDWAGAEKEFKRAIELNPNSAEAHLDYALFLDSMGRMEEGEKEHLRAQEVDPFNERMNETFYHTRQYDRAIDVLRKWIERTPESVGVHWQLGILYDQRGMPNEAIAEWEQMFISSGYEEEYGLARALRRGYAKSGHQGALRELLKKLETLAQHQHVPPELMAYFYESLGQKDQAFAWLEKAYAEHNPEIKGLKTDLMWDGLRSDARFADLVRRVGLPQ
jgi:TolB-like protein/DNA-binding winged helix-turn-helix (wHTH) protein